MGTSFTPTYDSSLPPSGQEEEVDLELSKNHFISGTVEVNLGWTQDDNGNVMAPAIPQRVKKQLLEDSLPTQNIESTQKLKVMTKFHLLTDRNGLRAFSTIQMIPEITTYNTF
jgi:hypothetical protein